MYISLFYGFWAPPPTISDIRVPICGSYTPFQGNLCYFTISRDILTPFMGSMASRNGLETRNIQILPPPIHFSSHNTYQYRYLDHKLHFKSLYVIFLYLGVFWPLLWGLWRHEMGQELKISQFWHHQWISRRTKLTSTNFWVINSISRQFM